MEWCDDDDDDDYTARRDDGRVGISIIDKGDAGRYRWIVRGACRFYGRFRVALRVSVSSETERVWCGDHESIQSNRIEAARFRIDRVKDDGDATCDGLVSVGCGRRRA